MSPSRASRSSAGTSSATELRSASTSCWTSSSGTTDSARGTSRLVQSTISGVGCTSTVALKLHGSLSEVGSAKSYSGVATGGAASARAAFQNQPPMWRLDRLGPEAILADVRDEHLPRHLPLAEPGNPDGAGEVGGRVLDRVLELVRRDVDREADAVPAELLHLAHAVIQAERVQTAFGVLHPKRLMRAEGLEPPSSLEHRHLKPACFPISPRPQPLSV